VPERLGRRSLAGTSSSGRAAKALQLLVESNFRGKTVLEFHGPEVLTATLMNDTRYSTIMDCFDPTRRPPSRRG
jgi:hypothetical protein